ncbi:MAG: putative amino acid transporter [Naasia sp.]|nr:putative amino acid transporter [Naasia sp.]
MSEIVETTSGQHRSKLRSSAMGTTGLVVTVAATVGVMAAFMGAAPIVFIMSGAGATGTYLLSGLLFLIFAVGYLAMSRRAESASGFVAFITKGTGSRIGVAAAYVTLLTYTTVLAGLYGIYAMFAQQAALELFGVDVPWGVWALATVVLLGVLSFNRVEISTRVMGTLVVLAVAAVLVLDVAILFKDFGSLSLAGFSPELVFGPGFGPAMLFALGSFLGVESTAVFSEEVRNPRKTIPRATYIAIGVIGGFYVLSTFLVGSAVGVDKIMTVASENPTGFIFAIASDYVGPLWASVLNVLVVTSFFAVVLGFTNVMSRYLFALGRAGILPQQVGRSHKKHQSPHIASVVTGIAMLVILLIFILSNADPFAHLYTWFLAIATVGVLALMLVCSIAVVIYFRKNPGDEGPWRTLIAPLLATLGFGAAIVAVVANFNLFAGDQASAQWLWVAVPLVAAVGLIVGSQARYRGLNLDSIG